MGPSFRRDDRSRLRSAAEIRHDATLALCRPNASFSKSCAIVSHFVATRVTLVMPGLVPAIHVFLTDQTRKTWMAGRSPAMTNTTSSLQRRQQSGHQAAALGEAVDLDVFVERMRIGATNAQAIEGGDSHRAGEITVGAAAGAAVGKLDAHLFRHAARS